MIPLPWYMTAIVTATGLAIAITTGRLVTSATRQRGVRGGTAHPNLHRWRATDAYHLTPAIVLRALGLSPAPTNAGGTFTSGTPRDPDLPPGVRQAAW
jgi:hypothetical protein